MAKHARLSLSGSKTWISCPASINLCEKAPPKPGNNNSKIGTIIHGAYERAMNGHALNFHPLEIKALNKLGTTLEWSMEVLQIAVEETNKIFDEHDIARFGVEMLVNPGKPWGRDDCWGTSDIVAINDQEDHLMVLDLKTGRIGVTARKNSQLMLYGLGALGTLKNPEKVRKITLGIIQPPIDKKGSLWATTIEDLRAFEQEAKEAAFATDVVGIEPVPSPAACEYCAARPTCPAFFKKSLSVFDEYMA